MGDARLQSIKCWGQKAPFGILVLIAVDKSVTPEFNVILPILFPFQVTGVLHSS